MKEIHDILKKIEKFAPDEKAVPATSSIVPMAAVAAMASISFFLSAVLLTTVA